MLYVFFVIMNWPLYAQNNCTICNKLKNNVVKITATFTDGKVENGFGSVIGERIDKLYIVTAKHVVYDTSPDNRTNSVKVTFSYDLGNEHTATPLNVPNTSLDISLLEVIKPTDYTWTKNYYSTTITPGTRVWFIGRGGTWYIPTGPSVGSINTISVEDEIIIDINSIQPGTSGAPLISDKGIVGLIFEDALGGAKAYSIEKVRRLIEDIWNYPWQMNSKEEENELWAKIRTANEVQYYDLVKGYLDKFPEGQFVDRIETMTWQKVLKNDRNVRVTEGRKYIWEPANGEAAAHWRRIRVGEKEAILEAFNKYVSCFPNGRNIGLAREKIRKWSNI